LLTRPASDLQEQVSKFGVVFGEYADETLSWAEACSGKFNRTRLDVIAWMNTLQDTFVPLGFSRNEAAKLSFNP